jgi:hypothetical protein
MARTTLIGLPAVAIGARRVPLADSSDRKSPLPWPTGMAGAARA